MGRAAKPWYRAVDGWWYATITKGTPRHKLLKGKPTKSDERKAIDIFNRLKAATNPLATLDDAECAHVVELFLEHIEAKSKSKPDCETYTTYSNYLNEFTAYCGRVPCRDLSAQHGSRFLKQQASKRPRKVSRTIVVNGKERKHVVTTKAWGPNTQATFFKILKTCFNWAVKTELISRNPFAHLQRSFTDCERDIVDDETWNTIVRNVKDRPFLDVLTALRETGCRPSEIARVRAEDVHGVTWVLKRHKNDGTEVRRVIYLNQKMQELTKRLLIEHPTGLLFRNSYGNRWTKDAIVSRFDRLRERLGLPDHVMAYTAGRHSYITQALTNGVPTAIVAHLCGTSDRVIKKNYSHLDSKAEFMLASAEQATARRSSERA